MKTASDSKHKKYCLHHLFEEQVLRVPDTVAVIFENTALTYRQLNQRSNQLAHHLRTLNLGPGNLTGIFLNRSAEMLIALLGALKAGTAYVPLDPDYPSERLAYMIKDADLSVLITQDSLMPELPQSDARIVCLDADANKIAEHSCENPRAVNDDHPPGPDNLAYVIYTSGSTGNPKGVQVPHSAVVNFLISMAHKPGMTENDILLAVTTLSFDISVLELFLPISLGACTVIADQETAANGKRILQTLVKTKATVMQATPVTWQLLINGGWLGTPAIKVLCGGESVSRDLANQLIDRSPSVWNMYGPTETTVWSTCCQLQDKNGPVLIGRPIANTQVYILDKHMQPVPVGVSGELYIGGTGITRGYRNKDNLTTKAFVPNPFSADPHALMYKTGDVTRYHADGKIEYLNRIDHQVKIRGFRIELGEIESVLLQHPSVTQSVVVVREDRPGDTRLVAYLVSADGIDLNTADLRQVLRQKLPEYMVPQHFINLDALPRTPNGKINRKALPMPQTGPHDAKTYVAPKSTTEKQLADIWANVLDIGKVGLHDGFFDIGGHSILAIQMISRVRDSFNVEMAFRKVFETPTLIDIARHIEALQYTVSPMASLSGNDAEDREEIEF
jgi:amino acid adenylation domain-containing protein